MLKKMLEDEDAVGTAACLIGGVCSTFCASGCTMCINTVGALLEVGGILIGNIIGGTTGIVEMGKQFLTALTLGK